MAGNDVFLVHQNRIPSRLKTELGLSLSHNSPDYAIGTNPQNLIIQILTANHHIFRSTVSPAVAGKLRRCCFTVKASSSAVVDDDAIASLERCFQASPPAADAPSSTSSSSADFGPVMKGKYGAFGAVTLEKSKLDLTQKQTKSSPELSTGGGGGNIGKGLSHGGGDGGDDGGDDDDYFDDFDEGDEGDEGGPFRRRIILAELFDRKFVDAVLNEWQKTMMDLPAGFSSSLRNGNAIPSLLYFVLETSGLESDVKLAPGFGQLCPNGEVSGNQCQTYDREVHFSVSSPGLSRAFIGRMIADPAFLYRLLLEQATTIGCSVWWEIKNRKERIKQEWDLALINILTVTACNAIVLRLQSFFYKAAELCMVGFTAGAAQGAISNLAASKKEGSSYVVSTEQLPATLMIIGVALFFSTALRVLNVQLGETSRLAWLGVEVDPLAQSDDLLKAAYNRPSEGANESSSKWFISKNAIVSGLGLLGIRQGRTDSNTEGEAPPPKARRKRIVRRKVATS
ncbi:UNVERIFIED_CONTAM: hypothetical protein Sradi_4731800 [Sesamum radiatum]|uniref:Uncharacterized protein n=1 Tax=Sesamum radiatum TaxID=300843 RepID=A0AAW2MWK7_SESRA